MCPKRTSCRERAPQSWWPGSTSQMSHPGPAGSSMEATSAIPHRASKEWARWAQPHHSTAHPPWRGHSTNKTVGMTADSQGPGTEPLPRQAGRTGRSSMARASLPHWQESGAGAGPKQQLLSQPSAPCEEKPAPGSHGHRAHQLQPSLLCPQTHSTPREKLSRLWCVTGADKHQPCSEHSTQPGTTALQGSGRSSRTSAPWQGWGAQTPPA